MGVPNPWGPRLASHESKSIQRLSERLNWGTRTQAEALKRIKCKDGDQGKGLASTKLWPVGDVLQQKRTCFLLGSGMFTGVTFFGCWDF